MRERPHSLRQIENQSLSDQAAAILRRAILNGQFKPGAELNETDLAEQLGTSRGPIREALRILNTEGLAETVPYHGTRVRSFTLKDIEELYSMRVLMETFAVRRIIDKQDNDGIAALRTHYEGMVAAAAENDFQKLNELDRTFHDSLIATSDHKLMKSLWQMVAMRVQQIMALNNRRISDLHQIATNHLLIIEQIEAGETEIACSLLEDHIVTAGDVLVEAWQTHDDTDREEDAR
jgi:DNA-binding GntR family transcriptional regulator